MGSSKRISESVPYLAAPRMHRCLRRRDVVYGLLSVRGRKRVAAGQPSFPTKGESR